LQDAQKNTDPGTSSEADQEGRMATRIRPKRKNPLLNGRRFESAKLATGNLTMLFCQQGKKKKKKGRVGWPIFTRTGHFVAEYRPRWKERGSKPKRQKRGDSLNIQTERGEEESNRALRNEPRKYILGRGHTFPMGNLT